MPFPKPLNVVVGAPVVFDVDKCEGGENVDSLDKMVDSYHQQVRERRTMMGQGGMNGWEAAVGIPGASFTLCLTLCLPRLFVELSRHV